MTKIILPKNIIRPVFFTEREKESIRNGESMHISPQNKTAKRT